MKRTKDELLQCCLKQFTHMDFVNENKTLNTTKSLIMEIKEAINYTHCCKSDSEQLVCKGRCDHGYRDEFGNELFCSIKEKCAN